MRCPDEETGRSSVSPWTIPRTKACQPVSAPDCSPTPAAASTKAIRRPTPAARLRPARRTSLSYAPRMSRNDVILGVFAAALVIFSLVVALVIPKRNPGFPSRHLGFFIVLCALFIVAMLAAVEVLG